MYRSVPAFVRHVLIAAASLLFAGAGTVVSAQSPPQAPVSMGHKNLHYNDLRPGDHLNFQILEDGDPPVQLVINNDGMVDIPYLGDVSTTGLTADRFSRLVKDQLDKSFYKSATVHISLKDRPEKSSNHGRVFISGEVHRVGMVEIDKSEPNTVGKVILTNGGLGDFADARKIKIFRTDPTGTVQSQVVDLHEVIEKGRLDLDVPIYDGDFVVVGSKLVNW
jgi:protein involved in polysaccharide export with SLBB domain